MRSTFAILGLALTTTVVTGCPYAELALENPNLLNEHLKEREVSKAGKQYEKRQSGPGNIPFTTFNENQLIDVTGEHAWVAPGPNDLRGPCPGLNVDVGTNATEQVYGQSRTKSLEQSNSDQDLVWILRLSYLCMLHLLMEMSCT